MSSYNHFPPSNVFDPRHSPASTNPSAVLPSAEDLLRDALAETHLQYMRITSNDRDVLLPRRPGSRTPTRSSDFCSRSQGRSLLSDVDQSFMLRDGKFFEEHGRIQAAASAFRRGPQQAFNSKTSKLLFGLLPRDRRSKEDKSASSSKS